MKRIVDRSSAQGRAYRTEVWLLCALAALSGGALQAQNASIKGTVDARSASGPLTAVKVVVIDRKSKTVVVKKAVENGQYEIPLSAGSYEVFACDSHLEYEPYSRVVDLKDGGAEKKDFHLTKKPLLVPAVDDDGKALGPNVAVCVQHLESACVAETTTDANGQITIPGPEAHFEVRERGGQPCE